jgi:hypothetical protein
MATSTEKSAPPRTIAAYPRNGFPLPTRRLPTVRRYRIARSGDLRPRRRVQPADRSDWRCLCVAASHRRTQRVNLGGQFAGSDGEAVNVGSQLVGRQAWSASASTSRPRSMKRSATNPRRNRLVQAIRPVQYRFVGIPHDRRPADGERTMPGAEDR